MRVLQEGMDRLTPASDVEKASASKIPLGRMGRVRDIADATVYLFSDAGSYVNGEVLIGIGFPVSRLRVVADMSCSQWTAAPGTLVEEHRDIPCHIPIFCFRRMKLVKR